MGHPVAIQMRKYHSPDSSFEYHSRAREHAGARAALVEQNTEEVPVTRTITKVRTIQVTRLRELSLRSIVKGPKARVTLKEKKSLRKLSTRNIPK